MNILSLLTHNGVPLGPMRPLGSNAHHHRMNVSEFSTSQPKTELAKSSCKEDLECMSLSNLYQMIASLKIVIGNVKFVAIMAS